MGIKNEAVLAIFYCGLQSVKSFHISPLDRRDCKDRHNFEICKTKATVSGGGFCTIYNRYGEQWEEETGRIGDWPGGVPASCTPPLPMRRTAIRCGSCCVCRRRRTARRCVTDSGRKIFHRFAARRVGILVRSSYFCKIEGAGCFRIRSTKRRNRYGIYKRGTGAYASCG